MNNVKESIGWADYTWNPITGCKNTCKYCYARRIHERFYKTPFTDIVFHDPRMQEKMPKKASKIFVGSMSDIRYWKYDWLATVLNHCATFPMHTFMFLSKSINSWYRELPFWPSNTMQGFTMDCHDTGIRMSLQEEVKANLVSLMSKLKRPYLSIEPLLGTVPMCDYRGIELVIVGAMTGAGAVKPLPEWIQSVKDNIPADKIYWKSNIKKYL